jgi:hypothetical protein
MKQKIILLILLIIFSYTEAQEQNPLAIKKVTRGAFWEKNPCGDHIGKISKYIALDKGKTISYDGVHNVIIDNITYSINVDRVTYDETTHILFAATQCKKINYTVDSKNYLDAAGGNIWSFVSDPSREWFDQCSNLLKKVIRFNSIKFVNKKKLIGSNGGIFEGDYNANNNQITSKQAILIKDNSFDYQTQNGTSGGTFEGGHNTNNKQTTSKRAILIKDNSLDYQTQNGTNLGQIVCLDSYLENDELLEIYNEYTSINHITEKSKYQWKSGFNLDMFDRIQNRKLRRAFKKCVTGKTRAGRHVLELIGGGTLIGVGVAVLLSSLNNSKGSVNFGGNQTN